MANKATPPELIKDFQARFKTLLTNPQFVKEISEEGYIVDPSQAFESAKVIQRTISIKNQFKF